MTFDSEVELMKVARAHPKAKLVCGSPLMVKAVCRLECQKFGARTAPKPTVTAGAAKELDIDVIGVSFHVQEKFAVLILRPLCRPSLMPMLTWALRLVSTCICLILVVAFPGSEDVKLKFEEITSVIQPSTGQKYFPHPTQLRIIAGTSQADAMLHQLSTVNNYCQKTCIKGTDRL